jgi:hypothetical protein
MKKKGQKAPFFVPKIEHFHEVKADLG